MRLCVSLSNFLKDLSKIGVENIWYIDKAELNLKFLYLAGQMFFPSL